MIPTTRTEVEVEDGRQSEPPNDDERNPNSDEVRAPDEAGAEDFVRFRTVFSSTEPVHRVFWLDGEIIEGMEVLDHSPESVDLTFFRRGGAPLLMNHNHREQVGVIDAAELDGNTGVAEGRFSRAESLREIVQDVKDGIRRNTSVGYEIRKIRIERDPDKPDDLPTLRAIEWAPYETSILSVPADMVSATIEARGRAETRKVQTRFYEMADRNDVTSTDGNAGQDDGASVVVTQQPAYTIEGQRAAEKRAAEAERARIDRIREVSARHQRVAFGEEHIAKGTPIEQFDGLLLANLHESGDQTPLYEHVSRVGMEEKEKKRFSLSRLLYAMAHPKDQGAQERAAFEYETCSAAAQKIGRSPRTGASGFIPMDVLEQRMSSADVEKAMLRGSNIAGMERTAAALQRTLSVGTATAGGNLVGIDHLGSSFIEFLYNNMAVRQLGATVLSGLRGNVAIPKRSGAGSARWTAEQVAAVAGANLDIGDSTFASVPLTHRELTTTSFMSRPLLLQSDPSVDLLVRADLSMVIALAVDAAAISGNNTADPNQPNGVLNATGTVNVPIGPDGGNITWPLAVSLVRAVKANNAFRVGGLGILMNSNGWHQGMITPKNAGGDRYVIEEGSQTMVTVPFVESEQVPSNLTKGSGTNLNAMICGAWNAMLMGEWGTLEVQVDPYSFTASGGLRISMFYSTDIAFRHPEVFSFFNDLATA